MLNNIAIVDTDSIVYSIGQGNKVLDSYNEPLKKDGKFVYEDKTNSELAESCDFIMTKILTNCDCDSYIAYIKGDNTTKAKRLIDPNYKADRNKESPKWWDFVKNYLIQNWGVIEAHDLEVDDFVNITRLNLKDSFIVAIDSDLLGLEGTHFNWKKNNLVGEWVTTTAEQAEYKFWSDMITGTHNNTKGLPGKGDAFVKKLLSQNESIFKTLNSQYFRNQVFEEFITHFGEELGIEEFYKNYKMIKILDKIEGFVIPEPIRFKKKEEIREEKGIFD